MRKSTTHIEKNATALVNPNWNTEMLSYSEEPPVKNAGSNKSEMNKELEASELFSIFTANIIKEDVIFIR